MGGAKAFERGLAVQPRNTAKAALKVGLVFGLLLGLVLDLVLDLLRQHPQLGRMVPEYPKAKGTYFSGGAGLSSAAHGSPT